MSDMCNQDTRQYFPHLVGSGLELETGDFRDGLGDLDVKALSSVETLHLPNTRQIRVFTKYVSTLAQTHGSDSRSTLSQHAQTGQNTLDPGNSIGNLLNVSAKLLTERERGGILQVSSTNLDDILELSSLGFEGIVELVKGRQEAVGDFDDGGNVHGRREAVGVFGLMCQHVVSSVHIHRDTLQRPTCRWKIDSC